MGLKNRFVLNEPPSHGGLRQWTQGPSMPFPTEEVFGHVRAQFDVLAGLLEQEVGRTIAIDPEMVQLGIDRPEFTSYGLAAWAVAESTTIAILLPSELLPTEWDGMALAPVDIAERLVSTLLPDRIDYQQSKLTTLGDVAGAFWEETRTLSIPVDGIEHPVVMLIGLNNPDAVERVGNDRLLGLPVQVVVTLADKRIDISQLLSMGPGALVTFSKPAEDFLDLYVNNHLFARGEAVKIGEKFGLRINQIGVEDVRESPVLAPA